MFKTSVFCLGKTITRKRILEYKNKTPFGLNINSSIKFRVALTYPTETPFWVSNHELSFNNKNVGIYKKDWTWLRGC